MFTVLNTSSLREFSLLHTTIAQAVSPVTFNAVTSISIGRLIARINAYTDNAIGFVNPTPDKIVNRIIAPAPGQLVYQQKQ